VAGVAVVARLDLAPLSGLLKMRTARSAKLGLIAKGKANGQSISASTKEHWRSSVHRTLPGCCRTSRLLAQELPRQWNAREGR
jgi:hypothetical protein